MYIFALYVIYITYTILLNVVLLIKRMMNAHHEKQQCGGDAIGTVFLSRCDYFND